MHNISEAVVQSVLQKTVLKNFAKFIKNHLCRTLFFNKVTSTGGYFVKKDDPALGYFCNFANSLWRPILENTYEGLFLKFGNTMATFAFCKITRVINWIINKRYCSRKIPKKRKVKCSKETKCYEKQQHFFQSFCYSFITKTK